MPQLIATAGNLDISPKSDDDVEMGRRREDMAARMPGRFKLQAEINWDRMLAPFLKQPEKKAYENLSSALVLSKTQPERQILEKYAGTEEHALRLRKMAILLMSTPEYQLC